MDNSHFDKSVTVIKNDEVENSLFIISSIFKNYLMVKKNSTLIRHHWACDLCYSIKSNDQNKYKNKVMTYYLCEECYSKNKKQENYEKCQCTEDEEKGGYYFN